MAHWAFSNAPAIIANISVLAIFGAIVAAGIMRGLKEFRDFRNPATKSDGSASPAAQIAAATILENVTLNEWSRSNKEVAIALGRLCDILVKHHDELADHRRVMEDVQHELHRGNNR